MGKIARRLHFWNLFFRVRFCSRKNGLLAVLMLFLIITYMKPLRDFAILSNHLKVSVWVYLFLMTDVQFLILFTAGVIYFFSDFPLLDGWNNYYMLRLGRVKWLLVQIEYIVASAVIIVGIVFVFTAVVLWPYTDFTAEWGKVLYTIAKTDAGQHVGMFWTISLQFLNQYSPLTAACISAFISILGISFIGITMMACRLCVSKSFGILLLTALTVLVPVADYFGEMFQIGLTMFSPVSWMRVANLGIVKFGNYIAPPVSYAVSMYLGIIGIVSIFLAWKVRKIDF